VSSRPNAAAAVPALTSASAAVTDRYAYEAFGVLLEHTGSAPNPFLFTGAVADPASGLVDLRARWLHPRLGILLSRDPFSSAGITEIPNPAEVLGEVGEFIGERWEDLRRRIQRNAGFIGQRAGQVLFIELGQIIEARARRAGNFIFYAPSPPGKRREKKFADFLIGRQGGFEVALPLTGGGRLFGFGYRDKRTKAGKVSERQFFRLDYAERFDYGPHCHFGHKSILATRGARQVQERT